MGGHAAGDVASAAVINAIRSFDVAAESADQLTAILGTAIREANQRLAAKTEDDRGLAGMGSTLTALLWRGSNVAIANIGDSRAYRLRRGNLTQITEDHVLSKLVANPMPSRIGEYLVRFLDERPGWSPDLTVRTARPGDRYLICSDGLSGVVSHDLIRDVLADTSDPDQAVETLTHLTYEAGAPDNVTLVVMDLADGEWHERNGRPAVLGAAGVN
jgi:protein phosphatase